MNKEQFNGYFYDVKMSYEAYEWIKALEKDIEKLEAALESCKTAIDDDFVTTTTEDGEQEKWVSFNQICSIVDEALSEISKIKGEVK